MDQNMIAVISVQSLYSKDIPNLMRDYEKKISKTFRTFNIFSQKFILRYSYHHRNNKLKSVVAAKVRGIAEGRQRQKSAEGGALLRGSVGGDGARGGKCTPTPPSEGVGRYLAAVPHHLLVPEHERPHGARADIRSWDRQSEATAGLCYLFQRFGKSQGCIVYTCYLLIY